VVRRGERLFAIDNEPVVLLYGSTPAWRSLGAGVDNGWDVKLLERNLDALGYEGFSVDTEFTSATEDAVREWQADIGAVEDGVVDLGEVVFLPAAVRVDERLSAVGRPVAAGAEILAVGPNAPEVTVDLETDQLSLLEVGERVGIELATGDDTAGTVRSIGQEDSSAGQQNAEEQTVPATIALRRTADVRGYAGSAVTVYVTTATSKDVLAVPVTALLALAGGGYAVQVQRGATLQTVRVEPRLYDDRQGLVEITATGLRPADRVVVAGP
jgi:peptidoglycan hydrolase-like protein with peptidoglycan-binding domain